MRINFIKITLHIGLSILIMLESVVFTGANVHVGLLNMGSAQLLITVYFQNGVE